MPKAFGPALEGIALQIQTQTEPKFKWTWRLVGLMLLEYVKVFAVVGLLVLWCMVSALVGSALDTRGIYVAVLLAVIVCTICVFGTRAVRRRQR